MKKIFLLFVFLPLFSNAQIITTVVGDGTIGYSGDGGPATAAQIYGPDKAIFDHSGNMYYTEQHNNCVRKVNTSGIMSTYAGTGGVTGYSGDGGAATAATLSGPTGIAFDTAENLYIADRANNCIRKVTTAGIISTYAGTSGTGYGGDGGPATSAELNLPNVVAIDTNGNLYICDAFNNRIRKVNAAGIITTISGTGTSGFSGDGGPASAAQLSIPTGVQPDAAGNIYILDGGNSRIRMIDAFGIINTIAGNGTSGYSGDGGPATAAELGYSPWNVSLDRNGDVYIADEGNNVIRKITLSSGIINTVAGNNTAGYSGDGGLATNCELNQPSAIGFDTSGNGYVSDWNNNRIRKIPGLSPGPPLAVNNIGRQNTVTLFPNPANTELIIAASDKIVSVTICNLLGQVVCNNKYNSSSVQVHVADLPAGTYFVKINGSEVRKIIKE
jgi:sugar lactone lactonase YvrE